MSGPVVFGLRLLLTVSLYGFLVWAFLFLARDLKLQGALLAARRVPPIRLEIQRGQAAPLVRRFIQSEIIVGRDPTCECPLEGDESISARHARLSYHHNQWWLEDLNSTNGTVLNHEKLGLATVITDGDEFACGEARISIALSDETLTQPVRKS